MSRVDEIYESCEQLGNMKYIHDSYCIAWHLADISETLAMLYDLFACECTKEIHMDNNGIRFVPCSEVKHENNE